MPLINKKEKSQKNNFYSKKSILVLFLIVSLFFAPIQTPRAHAWAYAKQEALRSVLDKVADQILGVIMGALKTAAAKMISEKVSDLVSGTSSQDSLIISDYRDFLYTEPLDDTKVYMNDYLTQMVSGRGSASNYVPSGSSGFGSGTGGNYSAMLVDIVQKNIIEPEELKPDYVGNPSENMFEGGNLENFNKYLSGVNNPWAFELYAQQKFSEQLEIRQNAAMAEGIAGKGMKSTRSGDTIVTPGALTADNLASVMDLGNKIVSGAQSIPEVITGVVSQIITQSISNGIGKAAENAQREGKASNWTNPDTQATKNNETSNSVDPATGQPYN